MAANDLSVDPGATGPGGGQKKQRGAQGGVGEIVQDQLTGYGPEMTGPNAKAYDQFTGEARSGALGLYERGKNYEVKAPTIENKYQDESRGAIGGNVGRQGMLAEYYQRVMEGKEKTAAQAQLQAGTDAGIAAQMAAARSARGAAGQAAAMRGAQSQAGMAQAKQGAAAATLQAQEAAAAASGQAGVYGQMGQQLQAQYGLEQQSSIEQARLASEAARQKQAMELGLTGEAAKQQQLQLQGMQGYQTQSLEQQKAQAAADAAAQKAGMDVIGGAAGFVGGLFMSDEKKKSSDYMSKMGGGDNSFSSSIAGGYKAGSSISGGMGDKPKAGGIEDVAAGKGDTALPDYVPTDSKAGADQLMSSAGKAGPYAGAPAPVNVAPQGASTPWLDQYMSSDENKKADDYYKTMSGGDSGGGGMDAGKASMAMSMMSDERSKYSSDDAKKVRMVDQGTDRVDEFLNEIRPMAYYYKQEVDAPNQESPGSMYLGVSAQDMERTPDTGDSLVVDTPRGKMVNTKAALSAALASVARLNQRLKALGG